MGALVEAIVGAVVALDLRQDLLVTLVGGDAALDASHGSRSLLDPAVSSGPLTPGVDTPRAPPCGATPGRRPRRQYRLTTSYTPYGSSFSTDPVLALFNSSMRSNCRFTRGAFLRRLWLFIPFVRMILPVAVI